MLNYQRGTQQAKHSFNLHRNFLCKKWGHGASLSLQHCLGSQPATLRRLGRENPGYIWNIGWVMSAINLCQCDRKWVVSHPIYSWIPTLSLFFGAPHRSSIQSRAMRLQGSWRSCFMVRPAEAALWTPIRHDRNQGELAWSARSLAFAASFFFTGSLRKQNTKSGRMMVNCCGYGIGVGPPCPPCPPCPRFHRTGETEMRRWMLMCQDV